MYTEASMLSSSSTTIVSERVLFLFTVLLAGNMADANEVAKLRRLIASTASDKNRKLLTARLSYYLAKRAEEQPRTTGFKRARGGEGFSSRKRPRERSPPPPRGTKRARPGPQPYYGSRKRPRPNEPPSTPAVDPSDLVRPRKRARDEEEEGEEGAAATKRYRPNVGGAIVVPSSGGGGGGDTVNFSTRVGDFVHFTATGKRRRQLDEKIASGRAKCLVNPLTTRAVREGSRLYKKLAKAGVKPAHLLP